MRAFIINLESATDRWAFMEKAFAETGVPITRVPAIRGSELVLPIPEYWERGYRWFHGRSTSAAEIGCYLSHLRAMEIFLATGEKHGLICEDDIVLRPGFAEATTAALRYGRSWNMLRLTGLDEGVPVGAVSLGKGRELCVSLGRIKGAGAYILDRRAAEAFRHGLLPMRLPYDHAFDREWFLGLNAAVLLPFPCSQTEAGFRSSIQKGAGQARKLPALQRWLTTYPYQVWNELSRWISRFRYWLHLRFFHEMPAPDLARDGAP